MVATVVGVVAGGVAASGTTATIVGAAIGGVIACWWYDSAALADYAPLPKKAALRDASDQSDGVFASGLRLVSTRR